MNIKPEWFYLIIKNMKLAIITGWFTEELPEIIDIIKLNREKYAQYHGYDLFCETKRTDSKRPPEWEKITAVKKYLSDYDWVLWTDADSLIINRRKKLENLIDNNYDIIITNDNKGINTGIFFIRNSNWSIEFLEEVYNQEQFIYDSIREEAAIRYLIYTNRNHAKHIKYIDQSRMNSYPEDQDSGVKYGEGDFIIHLKGYIKNKQKFIKAMTEWASISF